MLDWPPPMVMQATCRNPASQPRLTALRTLFDWAYMTRPAEVWLLPLQRQSDEVLRAVMSAARCYQVPCRGFDYMTLDPAAHLGEFLTITALAAVDPDDFIDTLHHRYPDDPFPAARLDPDGRQGRSLS